MSLRAPFIKDPEHWRARAAEARALAGVMSDLATTAEMLRVAADYETLAQRAEARRQGGMINPRVDEKMNRCPE
jgi:hypothetical protein